MLFTVQKSRSPHHELVALADNLMEGIEITDETLMLDEIHEVGPGGHFMDADQTYNRFRAFWYPGLLSRHNRPEWLAEGGTTLGQRLTVRVHEIIRDHQPQPLETAKKRKLQEVLAQV
jgi:trimethylamine--corrinoid protein Co-methyltransferase